jgi:ribosome biogenesis GTPase
LPLSAQTGEGVDGFLECLGYGRTGVLVGSSGVGKSTLTNSLVGAAVQAVREIRADDDRGRHATTHRELFVLPQGGVLIDTPGLREVGLWDDEGGVHAAFPDIDALAGECRFQDCAHGGEPGCAVAAAIEDGRLDAARLDSLHKLEREAQAIREKRDARARHEHRKERKRFARRVRSRPDKRRPPQ